MAEETLESEKLKEMNPVHQDELTMKQQENIEKEISSSIQLIGNRENLLNLMIEYDGNDVYRDKIKELHEKYGEMRRTRPDGNCFYRAFCYGTLEKCLKDRDLLASFRDKIIKSKELLKETGFTQFTVDDFYDSFIEILDKVKSEKLSEDSLRDAVLEPSISDYLVVYLRIVTSAELKSRSEFYANFIEGTQTLDEFCQLEVEPMFKESDHIHIIALTSALKIGVKVIYMDQGKGAEHDFPEGSTPTVHLLYRPGHYDIIYPVP